MDGRLPSIEDKIHQFIADEVFDCEEFTETLISLRDNLRGESGSTPKTFSKQCKKSRPSYKAVDVSMK